MDHFNLAVDFITDFGERDQLCRLNLAAGKRAKWANAYQQAFSYLQQSMVLLPAAAWQDDYPLALEIHTQAAESACIIGSYEAMEKILAPGFENAKTLLDRVELYLVKISGGSSGKPSASPSRSSGSWGIGTRQNPERSM